MGTEGEQSRPSSFCSSGPPLPIAPHLGGWVLLRDTPQQLGHDILHFHQSFVASRQLLLHGEVWNPAAACCSPTPVLPPQSSHPSHPQGPTSASYA